MKNKTTGPAGSKEAQTAPEASAGHLAQMFYCRLGSSPDAERGPSVDIPDRKYEFHEIASSAILHAAQYHGEFFGITFRAPRAGGKILVFSNTPLNDQQFLRHAAASHGDINLDEISTAKRDLIWLHTKLRGNDFIAYAKSVISVTAPSIALVWPLQYFFGKTGPSIERRLLNETGWILPPAERAGATVAPERRPPHYAKDADDPADWWKGGAQ